MAGEGEGHRQQGGGHGSLAALVLFLCSSHAGRASCDACPAVRAERCDVRRDNGGRCARVAWRCEVWRDDRGCNAYYGWSVAMYGCATGDAAVQQVPDRPTTALKAHWTSLRP
eukprot:352058-Chlamydomonas_euryale.AAC.5